MIREKHIANSVPSAVATPLPERMKSYNQTRSSVLGRPRLQEELEDYQDLKTLREEKALAEHEPSRKLEDVLTG